MKNDFAVDPDFSNIAYIEEQYARYRENPALVDASWHQFFSDFERKSLTSPISPTPATLFTSSTTASTPPIQSPASDDVRIDHLIQAYRVYGHLAAKVNPVMIQPLSEPIQLQLKTFGFTSTDLSKQFPTRGLLSQATAPLEEIIHVLQDIYCGTIGFEYMGLQIPLLDEWIQQKIESTRFGIPLSNSQKKTILQQLNQAELLESFLHMRYTGQKRFSLEGGETLIPMLDSVIETGSGLGVKEFVLGMAHRGRLNVLNNILNKSHADIFAEFEDEYIPTAFEGSGDVKYHKGFSAEVKSPSGAPVKIFLSPNPSHLESVDPVVEGQTRAKQEKIGDGDKHEVVMPLLIHGDAALAGQGVVYETMQLYRLPGYTTGGTLHFVINNHIGFTSTAAETQSTAYCTDIAKTFSAPVFHVNAEDPEACVFVTQLAVELRQKFHCDVFIDLNCYRKYGHNEGDEPAFTQPLTYDIIRKKQSIRELYRDQLIQHGVLDKATIDAMESDYTQALQKALEERKASIQKSTQQDPSKNTSPSFTKSINRFPTIDTKVSKEVLLNVATSLCTVPDKFSVHKKLQRLLEERRAMVQDKQEGKPVDWGMAELLAYGSLLWEGTHVRLSGQDCRRGTFSHRHATWIDQTTGDFYSPLNHLHDGQGSFDVFNSPLSEFAALGFEFGYSCAYPEALVIWEAQFGDFCNGAQIIIDQYIAPSAHKWGQEVGLVMLLPHGYEGQGPEHSSGRMERFLQLSGNDNIRVVNPTTPAQLFHLLRRQMLNPLHKPLIVFTPKGLLRYPACTSSLSELTTGNFQEIVDDPETPKNVKRIVLCSGRFYYDLIAERQKTDTKDLTIIRIEQLYPLNTEKLSALFAKYPEATEYIWAQEEPSNMGAWNYLFPILLSLIPKNRSITYVGRDCSASPAVGSHALHKNQHAKLMHALFGK
jgi:2-oxoglutarate dehydrogenase E1 component